MAPFPSQSRVGRLQALAERQWGVVERAQLAAIGFTRDEVRGMVRRGLLIRVHDGVYAVGHRRLPIQGRLIAALLAAGDGAFLSHRSAAAARGLGRHPRTVELTVPRDHTPGRHDGLHVHRTTTPIDRDVARPDNGLLVATVPRIVVDLAARERPGEIQRLIREAIRRGQFDPEELRRMIRDHPRRPGTRLAERALGRYLPGSEDRRSWLETRFQAHVGADPRLPTPLYNRRILGYEVDVVWPRERVTLELDGRPYHVAVEDFDRDRAKDRTLTRHHWRPLRIGDLEWELDRARVLEDLYAVLEG